MKGLNGNPIPKIWIAHTPSLGVVHYGTVDVSSRVDTGQEFLETFNMNQEIDAITRLAELGVVVESII